MFAIIHFSQPPLVAFFPRRWDCNNPLTTICDRASPIQCSGRISRRFVCPGAVGAKAANLLMKSIIVILLTLAFAPSAVLSAQSSSGPTNDFPLFVKVQLDDSVKLSALKPGDSVEGNLARDVYSPESRVFAAGSHVRLTVSGVERKRKAPSERLPWVARIFAPHHENFPLFKDVSISMSDGTYREIQTSLLSSNRMKEVRVPISGKSGKKKAATDPVTIQAERAATQQNKEASAAHGPVLYLEAYRAGGENPDTSTWSPSISTRPSVLPAGTVCRVLLAENISASKSHDGDQIHARLLEPLLSDSRMVIPAGSIFEGRVMKANRPRWLSRAGSLTIGFESIRLPQGDRVAISASLASVALNSSSPVKIDPEGHLHGSRPGPMWMLINGGVTAGITKEVDDGTQLIVEALISTATDASTAGTARLAGTIVSGVFMLTRKGHDVVLPNDTEMALTLNRPFAFTPQLARALSATRQTAPGN